MTATPRRAVLLLLCLLGTGCLATGGSVPTAAFSLPPPPPALLAAAWAGFLLLQPWLCIAAARALGVDPKRTLGVVILSAAGALLSVAHQPDLPLHTNGHAWREAREALLGVGPVRGHGLAPDLHGRAGSALVHGIARTEHFLTGRANPFRISRIAGAGSAAGTAILGIALTRSPAVGLATGLTFSWLPLARDFHVSGSNLVIAGWILPWSLALLLACSAAPRAILLLGLTLGVGLGTLSHTAMLTWAPALTVGWLIVAPWRNLLGPTQLAALTGLGTAWLLQFEHVVGMLTARNEGPGLLLNSWQGVTTRNLFLAPEWVSPALLPLALAGLVFGVVRWRHRGEPGIATAILIGSIPFFAVTICSSDAVRYESPLLGPLLALAVAGLTHLSSLLQRWSPAGGGLAFLGGLASLCLLPQPGTPAFSHPMALEHGFASTAIADLPPASLIVLPGPRLGNGKVMVEFPDFLLPPDARVLFETDPRVAEFRGPRFAWLGMACLSWEAEAVPLPSRNEEGQPIEQRPECRRLAEDGEPWRTRTLTAQDIPRWRDGTPWSFHQLAVGVPFGFYRLPEVTEGRTGSGGSSASGAAQASP